MTTNNEYDDLEDIEVDDSYKSFNENNNNNNNNKQTKKQTTSTTVMKELFSYVKIVIIAIVIAFICNQFVIVNAKVPTGSMKDTIMEGNRLIGFRLSYLFSKPQRLDVVIFKFPDDETQNYVKRIIGTPGDVVNIKEGLVYVNGELLDEPYIKEPMNVNSKELTYFVPEGHYFMLGDNRNGSQDSRFWENTFVAKDKILAKAIFKYYDTHLIFEFIK